jgi:hypothetical protein
MKAGFPRPGGVQKAPAALEERAQLIDVLEEVGVAREEGGLVWGPMP